MADYGTLYDFSFLNTISTMIKFLITFVSDNSQTQKYIFLFGPSVDIICGLSIFMEK